MAYADHFRFHPDPVLFYEVPNDGEYTLQIRDSIYRGRDDFVYRITVGEVPYVTGIFPLGGPAGAQTTVQLTGWNLSAATVVQDARDLLAEGLHLAIQRRAAHPADPHPDQDPAAVDGDVRRRPLAVLVHAGRFGAAPRAGHCSVPGPRPHADHVTRVLDIIDDQGRQPGKHGPHKLRHVNHD